MIGLKTPNDAMLAFVSPLAWKVQLAVHVDVTESDGRDVGEMALVHYRGHRFTVTLQPALRWRSLAAPPITRHQHRSDVELISGGLVSAINHLEASAELTDWGMVFLLSGRYGSSG